MFLIENEITLFKWSKNDINRNSLSLCVINNLVGKVHKKPSASRYTKCLLTVSQPSWLTSAIIRITFLMTTRISSNTFPPTSTESDSGVWNPDRCHRVVHVALFFRINSCICISVTIKSRTIVALLNPKTINCIVNNTIYMRKTNIG